MQDKIEKNDSADAADSVKQFNIMNEKLLPQRTNINKEHAAEEKKIHKAFKEYETAIETILAIHQKDIGTEASQVLITLLEHYVAKINSPLQRCSMLLHSNQRNDLKLAKHCLTLLKPNPDSNSVGDQAIYDLLKYWNQHPDELDIKQGTSQILCAFFSCYKHYIHLSDKLTEQLRVHDFWRTTVYNQWISPILNEIDDENDDVKKHAFEKLSALQKWIPGYQTGYQKYFTQRILLKLEDPRLDLESQKILIKSLINLRAWIAPSLHSRIIERLTVLIGNTDLDMKLSAKIALKKLMDDKTCSIQIDEAIEHLLKRKERTQLLRLDKVSIHYILFELDFLSVFASSSMQVKLMLHFIQEFLQTSDPFLEGLFCHSLAQIPAALPELPETMREGVIGKITQLLSFDRRNNPELGMNFESYCELFMRIKDSMDRISQENICYDLFKYYLEYSYDEYIQPVTKRRPQLIAMMSAEKRLQLVEYAFSLLLAEFNPAIYEDRKFFYLLSQTERVRALQIITTLIDTSPDKVKMHTQFFNMLLTIYKDEDEANVTRLTAQEILTTFNWYLSDEFKNTTIDSLFALIDQPKIPLFSPPNNHSAFTLKLIKHLSSSMGKTAYTTLNDKLLALFHAKDNPLLQFDIVQTLADIQPQLDKDKCMDVALSLISFLQNPTKNRTIKEAIVHFIALEQKRLSLPVYESAIPVLSHIIAQKTKHKNLQRAAYKALRQFSTSNCNSEQKEQVTGVLLKTIKKTKDPHIWKGLFKTIVALKDWLSPKKKEFFINYLMENIDDTAQDITHYHFFKTLFLLRDWLPAEQQSSLLQAKLKNFLLNLNYNSRGAYEVLEDLTPVLNENERIFVIRHLIANLDHLHLNLVHKLFVTHAAVLSENDQITLLTRLEKLGSHAESDTANEARSNFIEIYNLYSQSIVEKLVYQAAQQHHLPIEVTQHIWSYTL
ncbi:hypothetical protein [Legionella cherrii]|uniref:Uncharacterized protein n=1 Tax=Legionella cherrii TaxID=28084 RepID=A0ABY6T6T2_9GAMM|nr:hypothetical protein [Legionella cherrii]VEB37221.1 Uncharacterised protein [Legionella cherrii]